MGAERQQNDPFVAEVFYLTPPDILAKMDEDERRKFRNALSKGKSRHAIDIRLTIPLFFSGVYFVCQVGRDRRAGTGTEYRTRQRSFRNLLSASGLAVACAVAVVVGFVVLYVVKSKSGINLFPNQHLRDFIPVSIDYKK